MCKLLCSKVGRPAVSLHVFVTMTVSVCEADVFYWEKEQLLLPLKISVELCSDEPTNQRVRRKQMGFDILRCLAYHTCRLPRRSAKWRARRSSEQRFHTTQFVRFVE